MRRIFFTVIALVFYVNSYCQDKLEVYFDFNNSELTSKTKASLDSLTGLKKDIAINAVYGYCDWVDTTVYNDSLSLARAKNVENYLKESQFNFSDSYKMKGFGESFDQNPNQSENRKVAIHYSEKSPQASKPAVIDAVEVTQSKVVDKIIRSKIGDKIVLENINFLNLSDVLLPESKPAVMELIAIMKKNPNLVIAIQGHICCQVKEGKYDVSEARAKKIYDILIQNNIEEKRLSYVGFGGKFPIYKIPEKTEMQRIANRRVEIEIIEN